MAERADNLKTVRRYYDEVMNAHDLSGIDSIIRKDLIQHDAAIEDGRDGFIAHLKTVLEKRPVVTVLKVFDNENGEAAVFYKCFYESTGVTDKAVDIFRLEDGLIAEYWDVIEADIGDKEVVNGRDMFATYTESTPSCEAAEKEANTASVIAFNHDVFDAHDISRLDLFMRDDYMQHNTNVESGKKGFIKFTEFFFTLEPEMKIFKSFANEEGEVLVFFKCICHGNGWENKVADIYRLKDGLLAEHWDVVEHDIGNVKTKSGRSLF